MKSSSVVLVCYILISLTLLSVMISFASGNVHKCPYSFKPVQDPRQSDSDTEECKHSKQKYTKEAHTRELVLFGMFVLSPSLLKTDSIKYSFQLYFKLEH